jgi:hypothetical protein
MSFSVQTLLIPCSCRAKIREWKRGRKNGENERERRKGERRRGREGEGRGVPGT